MRRIKTFLVALVIILIALTSLYGIVKAAQVQGFHKNQRFVYIKGGTKDGFVVGAIVCIYSSSGKKITCGKVYKTSESKAMVGINREKAIYIKDGMEARLFDEEKQKH
jgi:hypothetical protein